MRSVPGWNQYFMDIAISVSKRSKDPVTQVGTVIVNGDNHIIGTGYNGMKPGVEETPELWQRPIKYQFVCHSERNAIDHAIQDLDGSIMYCTMHPCIECSTLIASKGIAALYYSNDKYKTKESSKILEDAGIIVIQLTS